MHSISNASSNDTFFVFIIGYLFTQSIINIFIGFPEPLLGDKTGSQSVAHASGYSYSCHWPDCTFPGPAYGSKLPFHSSFARMIDILKRQTCHLGGILPEYGSRKAGINKPLPCIYLFMSETEAKSSIGPGMGMIHLETGVQIIIPAQIEPERIVAAMEALLAAVKDNIGEGIACSDIAWMTSTDVNAMLLVSTDMEEGAEGAVAAIHAAADAFTERSGRVIAQIKADAGDSTTSP